MKQKTFIETDFPIKAGVLKVQGKRISGTGIFPPCIFGGRGGCLWFLEQLFMHP